MMYIPEFNPLSGDKEIYRYVGRVILRGGVPYRDVFDHKPPLIFLLNYVELLIGNWGQWLIDTCLALLATCLFFRLGRKYRLPYPWLLPLLFNLMLRDSLLSLGMGMTREYTAMLQLIFFCVLLGELGFRPYLLGLIAGLIFFMQQDQVASLIPFFIYDLLQQKYPLSLLYRLLRIMAGFLSVAVPLILYFAWHRSLQYLWEDAFLFNFTWYTSTLKESFGDHLRKIKMVLDTANYEMPFLTAIVLGAVALFYKSNNKPLIFASLAAVFLSLIPEFMGGRDVVTNINPVTFSHYFLPLSATICILLFCVFAFNQEPFLQGWKAQGIYGALVCCSLLYTGIQHGTHLIPMKEDPAAGSPEMNYLRLHRPGDFQLYEFGNNDYVYAYNEFGIIGPSRWVYQHFWQLYDRWDNDHVLLQSIGQDLLRHRTTYIINFAKAPSWFRDPSAYEYWHSFLVQHYQPVILTASSDSTLWKLKEGQ
jgi:hypothetical protein